MRIRIHNFFLLRSGSKGFDDQKLKKTDSWKFLSIFFWSKIAIYLSLGLPKRRPSYRRSLQPSKENIQHFQTWKFFTFFLFVGHPTAQINGDPDPQPWWKYNAQKIETIWIESESPKPKHFIKAGFLKSWMQDRGTGQVFTIHIHNARTRLNSFCWMRLHFCKYCRKLKLITEHLTRQRNSHISEILRHYLPSRIGANRKINM